MSFETPKNPEEPLLPQQYEEATGGGALAAEMARRGLSRRQVLRRAVGGVLGLVSAESIAGSLAMFYPNLAGQFGSPIAVGPITKYVASAPIEASLDSNGIFYEAAAKAYIVHLTLPTASFLLHGTTLVNQLTAEWWTPDPGNDGTYWIALYQKCVHLGCRVPFRDDCHSFKCPCHGSHYNVDGEYIDGPAPRSLDRFDLSFQGGQVIVNTGKINNLVQRPGAQTQLISTDGTACTA